MHKGIPTSRNGLHPSGYVLLEALIALIVVAVGVLGIAKLNAIMLQGAGASKAHTEALQIAQDQIEHSRGLLWDATGCDGLADNTQSRTGTNATYTVASFLTGTGSKRLIKVCVTWDGGTCAGSANRVLLSSLVSCEPVFGASAMSGASGGASIGGGLRPPSGRAIVGGKNFPTIPDDATVTTNPDGTRTLTTANGDRVLIGVNGEALLTTARAAGCETQAPDFSTLSGRIYIEVKDGEPIVDFSHISVLTSGASYCKLLPRQASWKFPADCSGSACAYFFTEYRCHVGPYWWGNAAVVRLDHTDINDKVCVGNPLDAASPNPAFDRRAGASTNRAYRGYYKQGTDLTTLGIGEQAGVPGGCSANGPVPFKYIPTDFQNHHFVLTHITGNQGCPSQTQALQAAAPGALGSGSPGHPLVIRYSSDGEVITNSLLFGSAARLVSSADRNPGKHFCFAHDDGGYSVSDRCPALSVSTPMD
jgi:Tfp pilus assembly protein PilV